jgi:hypothetical protein
MLSSSSTTQLLLAQASSLAALVSDNPGLTASARLAMAAQVSASSEGAPDRTTKRQSKVIEAEDRCCARVWGSGTGKDQCNSTHLEGSRYCKQHTTKSRQRILGGALVETGAPGYDEAEVLGARPCVLCEVTHKRVGLFTGDIDEACMATDQEGRFVVKWNNEETKDAMREAVVGGEFVWHPWAPGHGTEAMAAKKGSKGSKGSKGGGASKKEKSKPTDKVKKVRGKNSYLFYLASVRDTIVEELSVGGEKVRQPDIAKRAGAMWKELSEADKEPFVQMAADDKLAKQALADAAPKEVITANGWDKDAENYGSVEVPVNGGSAVEVPVAAIPTPQQLVEAATAAVSVEDATAADILNGLDALGEEDFSDDDDPEGYESAGGTSYMRFAGVCGDEYDDLVLLAEYEDEDVEEPAVVAHLYPNGRVEQADGLH